MENPKSRDTIQPEIRKKVHRLCCDYIGGIWKQVSPEDIKIQSFSGGYINVTLKVFLPDCYRSLDGEPTIVVIKINFGIMDDNVSKMAENIIAVLLANAGLAPKVYGIFEGGRIDEYIAGRPIRINELNDTKILKAISQKIARFHCLSLPLNKNPNRIVNQCEHFLHLALNDPRNKMNDVKRVSILEKFLHLDLQKELQWLKSILHRIDPPSVYSHGDFQINNILLRENSPDDPLHIIDYDFSGYNYRGHDFADLNLVFCFTVPYPDPPYFRVDWNQWPSLDQQKFIIRIYLEEIQKIKNIVIDLEQEEAQILKESKVCVLIFLYFLYVYGFQKSEREDATNHIDWLDVSEVTLDKYVDLKDKWLELKEC